MIVETRDKILKLLDRRGGLTTYDLMHALGKPKTTIVDNCDKLRRQGKVKREYLSTFGKSGRPPTLWRRVKE